MTEHSLHPESKWKIKIEDNILFCTTYSINACPGLIVQLKCQCCFAWFGANEERKDLIVWLDRALTCSTTCMP